MKVALVTIHGMNYRKDPTYYNGLRDNLIKEIGKEVFENHVVVCPVYYQDLLQDNQDAVWASMKGFNLRSEKLRRIMLGAFGDASSLEHSYHFEYETYRKVQEKVRAEFDVAYSALGGEGPVVVVATSLGCQVLYNYLRDIESGKGIFAKEEYGYETKRLRMRTLKTCKYLATLGCNIPLFVGGLANIECFSKPSPEFVWENFFDKDDVLGWPLKSLSPSFARAVDRDIETDLGVEPGLGNTPASHVLYWRNRVVVKAIASQLKRWIDA